MAQHGLDWGSLVAFDNVAAGHDGVMSDASGSLIIKPCVAAEVDFYEVCNAEHLDFAQLMPTFMGSLQRGQSKELQGHLTAASGPGGSGAIVLPAALDKEKEENSINSAEAKNPLRGKRLETEVAIVLENVLAGFKKPNFVDVKLGSRLWADDAPLAKRAKLDEVASQTTSGSLGFRIAGMKIWQPEGSGEYKVFDKLYGRQLTSENVKDAFSALVGLDQKTEAPGVVKEVITNLEEAVGSIEHIIASQESRMYSASLLFVYEGDPHARKEAIDAAVAQTAQDHADASVDKAQAKTGQGDEEDDEEDEDDEHTGPKLFDIKMIDFAHASWTPGQGPDENMLAGIRSQYRDDDETEPSIVTFRAMSLLPGLSLSAPSTTTPQPDAAAHAPPRTEELPPRSELRFEVAFAKSYRIRLVRGTAELFGSELAPSTTYTFSGTKGAVFTWHGCTLELQGEVESEYVGSETEAMVEWLNVHGMLETARDDAGIGRESNGGPRVLIVGPDDSGKTSLLKCLTAWSLKIGRTPTVVNMDPREGLLSIPGSLTAVTMGSMLDVEDGWGSSPVSGPTGVPVKTPLVYHFPFVSPEDNTRMFKPLITRAALAVTSRLEEDEEAKQSGIIIDTPGSINQPKGNYELLMHIISEFSINVVLTLNSERLYNDMLRKFANPKSSDEVVHVFRILKSGGAVARDEGLMRQARQQQIKNYFFGDSRTSLNPHGQWWDFGDLTIYKAVDASASQSQLSFMPGMDYDDDSTSGQGSATVLEKATPSQGMVNAIMSVKFCSGSSSLDNIRDSCVMGFVYVAEVDDAKKKVRFLAPHPSRWGDRALVWGNWPEGVGDLVA
ncbi:SAICAR synthase-like protein [Aureobasidium pullulans]|uniref:Polynucleotide 5'-hydroxyl-kinase GRC3 n=1 Tax=Aureobasidium pullulans TaxID=5580 RepID=A0A4S9D849_AURPU|nr:SAICAR synthase-like protein [Aureobasidium pullulans]